MIKHLITSVSLLVSAFILTEAKPVAACASTEVSGVLVSCIPKDAKFFDYVSLVLQQNTPYIIAVAVVIVIFSGVQYMMAMGTPGEQTKAKQRIIGVVTGIVFLTLIRFILSLISPSIKVTG